MSCYTSSVWIIIFLRICYFQTQIGLVYNPMTEEMYTARLGGGAFCNGQRIQASAIEGFLS